MADQDGGGFSDVTTRANLQLRDIKPADTALFLKALTDLGVVARGNGADNIRNVTASALAASTGTSCTTRGKWPATCTTRS